MTTQANQNQTKPKIPKLRFGEFRENWEEKKLGEVGATFSGGTPTSTNSDYYSGNIPFIKSGEISKDKSAQYITNKALNSSSAKMVKKGDLLYALYGATSGEVAISQIDGAINQAVLCIRTDENVKFIHDFLRFKKERILSTYLQGGQGNLSADIIKNLKINLPALPEQEKIAKFLSKVDEEIENLKSQKETLEKHKRGLMQKIFSRKIRFTDEGGSEFADWEEKRLGEVCEYKNGGAFEKSVVKNGNYNLITLNSIDITGKMKFNHKQVNGADWFLEKNDLIMVLSDVAHGDFLGLVDIIPENNKYVLNQRMGLLRSIDNNTNLIFLRKFINHNQIYFKRHGQGSSQQNLAKGDILKFKINLPKKEEQEKIAKFLSKIDETIECKQTEISTAEKWKKGLMGRMFC